MPSSFEHLVLHLSLIDGVGPAVITSMMTRLTKDDCANTIDSAQIYQLSASELSIFFNFSFACAQRIVHGLADRTLLDRELALIEKYEIDLVTCVSDIYPELLKEIHLPPPVLYVRGKPLDAHGPMLACVGSRKAGAYAQQVVDQLILPMVHAGWSIVSGGAIGVDSMAHRATINAGGSTIVVLGSGLLNPYPSSNKKLFELVINSGGTVISSFPLNARAVPGHFPARNRIISGLSNGVLVIQAAQKSGASITASYALEQGRDVFAVPGSIFDPLSAGCHRLMGQGAQVIASAQDLLQACGLSVDHADEQLRLDESLDPVYQNILGACTIPVGIDELANSVKMPQDQLLEKLFELQVQGRVVQNFMGMWQRI